MRNRKSTITQQYNPKFRRRISTTKSNYLNISMPHLILAEQDGQSVCPSEIIEQNEFNQQRPLTFNWENTRQYQIKVDEQIQQSKSNHMKIHKIIDEVDEYMRKRMDIHETQLLNVVRKQIDGMMEDSRRVIEHYNRMMQQKNKQSQIYNLQNQLNYFRDTSFKLYKQNNRLVEENSRLLEQMQQRNYSITQLKYAITKLTKKYLKLLKYKEHEKTNTQLITRKIKNIETNQDYYIQKYNYRQSRFVTQLSNKIQEEPQLSKIHLQIDPQQSDKDIFIEESHTAVYPQKMLTSPNQNDKIFYDKKSESETHRPQLSILKYAQSDNKLFTPINKQNSKLKNKQKVLTHHRKMMASQAKTRVKTETEYQRQKYQQDNHDLTNKPQMKIKTDNRKQRDRIKMSQKDWRKTDNFWKIKQYL